MKILFAMMIFAVCSVAGAATEPPASSMQQSAPVSGAAATDPLSDEALKAALKRSKGETVIIEALLARPAGARPMACGTGQCCCQAGTYGMCVARSDCPALGRCVPSAPGC